MKSRLLARDQRRSSASALVITLLAVVLITIVVIAFMQTTTLATASSKGYADTLRARLASQAGLSVALAQLRLATGTNLSFVTGITNYPPVGSQYNNSITVIGAANLTNLDQMMPLVSGTAASLTNFGTSGFATYFASYTTPRMSATAGVDINNAGSTGLNFIQSTSDTNLYRGAWVTMTNMVGNVPNYTRYAYVVVDESARINPLLATGSGSGYSSPFVSNWYTGPQDISITNANAQLLTPAQMQSLTTAAASFGYSDASLGQALGSRANYEAVKHFFTMQTNASVDMIPAWMPDGGRPKYNINDLATNTAYGSNPYARATNIANIIGRNLPNFYLRDPAVSPISTTLYNQRLAANIIDYISPDGTFGTSEYTTNSTGISPQGAGLYPVLATERDWLTGMTSSSVTVNQQFYMTVWNPYNKSIKISSGSMHVWNGGIFYYGNNSGAGFTNQPNYSGPIYYMGGNGGVVRPNEYVTLSSYTNSFVLTAPAGNALNYVNMTGNASGLNPNSEQFSLTINGQTTAQSQGAVGQTGSGMGTGSGWEQQGAQIVPTTNNYLTDYYQENGNPVADPRFLNYQATIWTCIGAGGILTVPYNGYTAQGNFGTHSYNPGGTPPGGAVGQMWTNGDYDNGNPPAGTTPTSVSANNYAITPDMCPSTYTVASATNAPETISNTNMASIGELGMIYDPAHVNYFLNTNNYRYLPPWGIGGSEQGGTSTYYLSPFQVGGARSLRLGAPEFNTGTAGTGWDVAGQRAISLLDLFTVNDTNLATGGAPGRINPNTASTNVLAAVFAGIKLNSNTNTTGGGSYSVNPATMATWVSLHRPYSCLSDLNTTIKQAFYGSANYSPAWTTLSGNPADYAIPNRVRQEAFGKWIQHISLQSHNYRVYVIGQVLDINQNPRGSVVIEAGVGLKYTAADASGNPAQYIPYLEYVRNLR